MARVSIGIPPGVYRLGTNFQAGGRWYDAWHTRWYGNALGPTGGWNSRGSSSVGAAARAIHLWKDNSSVTWIGIGTYNKLYVSKRDGSVFDITPVGLTAGRIDASASGGYGSGLYGSGTYGTPRPDSSLVLDATEWSIDNFGEDMVAISPDDGKVYEWTLNTASKAVAVSGAPTGTALVSTNEGFLFVFATTNPRTVSWCDQENLTVWTPSSTNQAGDYTIQTPGRWMCGKNVQGCTLCLTDQDAWTATYTPTNAIYSFEKRGDSCGAISRQCIASYDMQAAWMSSDCTFWLFNGYVQPIPCDVQDYIRLDINLLQISKVFATVIAAYSEIEWRYCSTNSVEIDSCVVWNYLTNVWTIGRVSRLCGSDKHAGFRYPIMVDSSGIIYDHEVGTNFDGNGPYATGGPVTLGNTDNVMHILGMVPDDNTLGDVSATFSVKNERDDSYAILGPFTLSAKTDLRFTARQVEVTYNTVNMANWRVGNPALDITGGGKRGI